MKLNKYSKEKMTLSFSRFFAFSRSLLYWKF